MSKEEKLNIFIDSIDNETMIEYSNKLYDNLRDLQSKEEKYSLWGILLIFLYVILYRSTIESLNLGPIAINDIAVISKILPLVLVFVLFNLYGITSQISDVQMALTISTEKRFGLISETGKKKSWRENIILRVYFPHTLANTVARIMNGKPNIWEAIIGFILFLPIIFIAFAPHCILILMLIDLFNHHIEDTFGKICFGLTLWTTIIMFFYVYKKDVDNALI